MALVLAPVAHGAPARYIYEQCDSVLPGGGVAGVSFASNAHSALQSENTCASPGGGLSISMTGNTYEISYWTLHGEVPPGGEAESVTVTAATCTGGQPIVVAFAYRPEWSNSCHDEVRTFKEGLSQSFQYYVWLGCQLFQSSTCAAGPWIRAHYFAITEIDPVPPTVNDFAGTLLAGGVIRGRQTIRATGSDKGGGVSSIAILVNGLSAAPAKSSNCQVAQADNPSVVGTVAVSVSPCPNSFGTGWSLNTGAYPFRNGSNSVQVCVSDFATLSDPNTTCTASRAIVVDNSCTESAVAGGQTLSAAFGKSRSDTEATAYGKRATVAGKLVDQSGAPVAGATLCVKSHTVGSAAESVDAVTTDQGGRYSYRLPAGPNREIVVGYRHDSFQVSRDLRLYSHVEPTLSARPRLLSNHNRVHFRGRLPGPQAGGRVVVLQANVTGSKRWITFRKATTGSKGAFKAAYQFTGTGRRTNYRFRALVPVQAGYPWLAGRSSPVRVVVTP